MDKRKLVVYLPAYNEEASICSVLQAIPRTYNYITDVEILVVDDGSIDNTAKFAEANNATVISHSKNRGVGKAFQTALNHALKVKADILVSIDADGQFETSEIEDMILPIVGNKADFCIGNRFWGEAPENMPKIKYWGNKRVNKIVSFISNTEIEDASCGFRAYSKESLYSLNTQGNFTYTHETILDLLLKGFHVQQIPIKVQYFQGRVSRVASNLFIYAGRTSLIIFKSLKDYKPLGFFLSIAATILLIAFLIGGFVMYHWIQTGMITPYKSLGFISLSLCGMAVVIITLAFIADMLNRIRENQEKLLYLAKKNSYDKD